MQRLRLLALSVVCLSLSGFGFSQAKVEDPKKEEKSPILPGRPLPKEEPSTAGVKKQASSEDKSKVEVKPEPVKPGTFESGEFKGLEPFGYSYFSAARQLVAMRTLGVRPPSPKSDEVGADKSKAEDTQVKPDPSKLGQKVGDQSAAKAEEPPKQEPINPLQYIVGPVQMSGSNVAIPAPDRYQLGPGDRINIRWSSPTEVARERTVTIDSQGAITVPAMGSRLVLRGMTLAQAEVALRKEVRRALRDAEVSLSLSELRSISISVVGEVVSQGSYQVPSVMTLFNALYAAGGPTMNGSMRNIQLRRSNGTAKTVDLYSFLLKGDASQDIALQPGDLILVPPATQRVAIKGEVGRIGVFEMKTGEKLSDLVKFAGGPKGSAITDKIEVISVLPGVERQLRTVDLKNDAGYALNEGDVVTLYALREEVENAVEVEGAVDQPRAYEWKPGLTVSGAIAEAHGLRNDAYPIRADLYRRNPDQTLKLIQIDLQKALAKDPNHDVAIQRNDRLRVYFSNEVLWLENRFVNIEGAVRKAGKYLRLDGMRLSDLILQAGGLLPEANYTTAFVYRKKPDGSEGELLKPNLLGVINRDPASDVVLLDQDRVVVYTNAQANFMPTQLVTVTGAVQSRGIFPRSENITARDLIQLAGGLTPKAGNEVQIARARVPEGTPNESYALQDIITGRVNPQIKDGDVLTIPELGNFQDAPILVEIKGRVKKPGVYAINSKTEKLSDLLKRAGGLMDDAWVEGALFTREPKYLTTAAEARLSPRVQELLRDIQEQAYLRALAKSDIDKIRAISSQQGSVANLGALTGQVAIPQVPSSGDSEAAKKLIQRETVTPARNLTRDETTESGNVPIRLSEAVKSSNSPHNMLLKDGDILVVPEKPTTVAIRGAVILPSTILFERGKTLDFYLSKSGGSTIDADTTQILVIRAGGTITRARGTTRIELGDTIFVPTKVMVAKLTDGSATFDSAIKSITNVAVIWALISRLF